MSDNDRWDMLLSATCPLVCFVTWFSTCVFFWSYLPSCKTQRWVYSQLETETPEEMRMLIELEDSWGTVKNRKKVSQ